MVTAVREMATAAIIFFDRSVEVLLVLDLLGKCRKDLGDGHSLRLFVTAQAEGDRNAGQQGSDG